jgi:homoserine dehydrogenase
VSDLISIVERGHMAHPDRLTEVATPSEVTDRTPSPFYLRFNVRDRPGILAAIAAALAGNDINIDSVLQEPAGAKTDLPFVVTLEECDPLSLSAALDEIRSLDFHVEPPLALPILS